MLCWAEQNGGQGFTANDLFFPLLEVDAIERGVRVSVIAELKAIISPQFKRIDAVVNFAQLVELFFIYETHRRNFLIAGEWSRVSRSCL